MNTQKLRNFVKSFTRLIERERTNEEHILAEGSTLLSDLVAVDDWLEDSFSRSDADRYRQYLLHCDPLERFSVVSFVWGPGQCTPIHDHTTWGLIGILRGAEHSERFKLSEDRTRLVATAPQVLSRGMIDAVSPRIGDIHRVSNGNANAASVSIHVYGTNIGPRRRYVFDPLTAGRRAFVSGYDNQTLPNIWT